MLHQLPLDAVGVMRTNRIGGPLSGTTVNCPLPPPVATALLDQAPSELTVTL
jgi:hypothetical protein